MEAKKAEAAPSQLQQLCSCKMEHGLISYGREHTREAGSSSWIALPWRRYPRQAALTTTIDNPQPTLAWLHFGTGRGFCTDGVCKTAWDPLAFFISLPRHLQTGHSPGALDEMSNAASLPKLHPSSPARCSTGHKLYRHEPLTWLGTCPCSWAGEVTHRQVAAAPLAGTSHFLRARDHTAAPQHMLGVTHAGTDWIERFYQVYSFKKGSKKLNFFCFYMYITKKIEIGIFIQGLLS